MTHFFTGHFCDLKTSWQIAEPCPLTGHVWLWETPENCFFAVLFVMTRSVSFLTIICMVIDGFIHTRNKTYYIRVFRHRDCIPVSKSSLMLALSFCIKMTGICWVLGFMVAISPFSNSRWQCHVYHALIRGRFFRWHEHYVI